jgi:excisionase family DNA binding protein
MRSIYSHQTGTDTPSMKTNDDGSTAIMEPPAVLATSEVSRLLGVSPNTVTRWAREGRLPCRLTLGGHHRFERHVIEEIRENLNRTGSDRAASGPGGDGAHMNGSRQ